MYILQGSWEKSELIGIYEHDKEYGGGRKEKSDVFQGMMKLQVEGENVIGTPLGRIIDG